MGIARYYQADRNPSGAALPGVPLADIDDETWARIPGWQQRSVDAWQDENGLKVYLKTYRQPPTPPEPEPEPEPDPTPDPEPTPPDDGGDEQDTPPEGG
jgi:hypothetical protein